MSESTTILPVVSRRDVKAFVRFLWRVYRGDRLWVPPLIADRLNYLDPKRGLFYKQADVALFMARRGRHAVGTIASFIDHARLEHLGNSEGGFGFFEVVDDYEVARQLLDACREWLRARGMVSLRGPTNFGDNDCPGVLVAGADVPPAMMEAHTPAYYREFLERYGMEKDHDLYAWRIALDQPGGGLDVIPPDILRVAEAARRAGAATIRRIRFEDWPTEVSTVRNLFNTTLSHIPDAVPLGEVEFRSLADQMRPFLDRELALIAEAEGRPVGFCILIPDMNRVLARLDGRLFPFRWLRVKRYIREIDVVSFKLMGVLKEFRHRGIDAMLYGEALTRAKQKGYRWLDGSLSSELNPVINLLARGRGAELYKQYRLYRMGV
jgi:GNAT superfamily N-acetyltransferase